MNKIYLAGQVAPIREDCRTNDFKKAVERSKSLGYEFVIEYKHDRNGKLVKTVLGWNCCIISYQFALKVFRDNHCILEHLKHLHDDFVRYTGKETNEVYLFAPKRRMFLNMSSYNYRKIVL